MFNLFTINTSPSIVAASAFMSSSNTNKHNDINDELIQTTAGIIYDNSKNVNSSNNNEEEEQSLKAAALVPATSLINSSANALSATFNNNTCVVYDSANRTINICGGSSDLSTINQIVNSSDVLNNTSDKNWMLNANISVDNGATLFINSTDTDWLRINSTAGKAYSIVVYGNLIIDRTKISSWNSISNTEPVLSDSANKSTPRGYLLMHWGGVGQMNITNSDISNLGFNSTKDTWGIAYYSGSGSILQNNSISSNFRGVYLTTNASNISVANNTIQNSSQHGLNLYKAKYTKIWDNKISENTEHGIFCTGECENALIKSNHILNNGRNGIVLNQDTTNSAIKQNILKDNNRSGIAIWNSSNNIVEHNLMQQNGLGTTIAQNSSYNMIKNNLITNSLSNGILLDSNSTNNRIEKDLINNSGGSGAYIRYASDNTLVENNITENKKSGIMIFNATRNEFITNNVSDNTPYNYYIRPKSMLNIIRDTYFDNTTLRFFDKSSNIILENTDNRITTNDNKEAINTYSTNATLLLEPINKNVRVNTLDMFVIPSEGYIEIFSLSKDFDANQKNKRWLEKSSLSSLMLDGKKTSTRYIVGNFAPNTQIMITVNNSFWNAYTSNSSGYIDFVYDGYESRSTSGGGGGEEVGVDLQSYRVLEFEAEANNRPTIATITLFLILIAGSSAFILVRRYLKRKMQR